MLRLDQRMISSMQADIRADRATEIDFLCGEIIQMANTVRPAVKIQVNSRITEMMHTMEQHPMWPYSAEEVLLYAWFCEYHLLTGGIPDSKIPFVVICIYSPDSLCCIWPTASAILGINFTALESKWHSFNFCFIYLVLQPGVCVRVSFHSYIFQVVVIRVKI